MQEDNLIKKDLKDLESKKKKENKKNKSEKNARKSDSTKKESKNKTIGEFFKNKDNNSIEREPKIPQGNEENKFIEKKQDQSSKFNIL